MTSVQFSSVAQSCPTLCTPMDCSMPGLPGGLSRLTIKSSNWDLRCLPNFFENFSHFSSVAQLCPTLRHPMDCRTPGFSVHFPFQLLSRVRLSVTPWTAARQASLSITNSWSLLKFMSIESVLPFKHLIHLAKIKYSKRVIATLKVDGSHV